MSMIPSTVSFSFWGKRLLPLSFLSVLSILSVAACWGAQPTEGDDRDGFQSIFDGQSLNGWAGDDKLWRVEDGAIVGETTSELKIDKNQFLIWNQGEVDDFVLKLKFRISGTPQANSGIQIRSQPTEDGRLSGYQSDIDRSGRYIGIFYSEGTGRNILGNRGQKTTLHAAGNNETEDFADPNAILEHIDFDQWNEFEIHATGNRMVNKINGHVAAEIVDNDSAVAHLKGLLGFQLHVGPPMKIEFKEIRLKRLPLANERKKIVFVAGHASHGPGLHEHYAGCRLLAHGFDQAAKDHGLKVLTTVYRNGWPADPTAFDNADTVVWYCDGGGGHYLHKNLAAFEPVMERGVGLVLLHYAVEAPAGPTGDRFLQWIGGYFEPNWSVNPIWTANFASLPDHPITRGISPFELHDEWYYHMRFVPDMKGVTPILSALPPADSLSRPDGPHSGNPHVRQAVLEDRLPQHVAWAYVREDGSSRGFGFTGGHFHKTWQDDAFRKLVLNAIAWVAKVDVPAEGVPSLTPTAEEIEANQDK